MVSMRHAHFQRFAAFDQDSALGAAPVPTMMAVGVARPNAHGQATMSTATALIHGRPPTARRTARRRM